MLGPSGFYRHVPLILALAGKVPTSSFQYIGQKLIFRGYDFLGGRPLGFICSRQS